MNESNVFSDDEVEQVNRNVSNLTKEEKLEIVAAQSEELLEMLNEFKTNISDVTNKLQPFIQK